MPTVDLDPLIAATRDFLAVLGEHADGLSSYNTMGIAANRASNLAGQLCPPWTQDPGLAPICMSLCTEISFLLQKPADPDRRRQGSADRGRAGADRRSR